MKDKAGNSKVIKEGISNRPNSPTTLNELLGVGSMNKKYQSVVKSWQIRKEQVTTTSPATSEKLMFMKDFQEFENTENQFQSKFATQINLLEE